MKLRFCDAESLLAERNNTDIWTLHRSVKIRDVKIRLDSRDLFYQYECLCNFLLASFTPQMKKKIISSSSFPVREGVPVVIHQDYDFFVEPCLRVSLKIIKF